MPASAWEARRRPSPGPTGRTGAESPAPLARVPDEQEDGTRTHPDEEDRVLAEALWQIERVAQLVGGPLELGPMRVDG